MSEAPKKSRAIKLVDFQEEVLPNGRKLLTCVFQNKYGDEWRYQWTPPWRDKESERGVISLTVKANEVEEWNDAQGTWDEELKKLTEEVQLLKELELPVKVTCKELAMACGEKRQKYAYRFEVLISSEAGAIDGHPEHDSFSINACLIRYEDFVSAFWSSALFRERGLNVDQTAGYYSIDDFDTYYNRVSFGVWIPHTLGREHYRVIGREVAAFVRSYLRRVLSDYQSISKGFED